MIYGNGPAPARAPVKVPAPSRAVSSANLRYAKFKSAPVKVPAPSRPVPSAAHALGPGLRAVNNANVRYAKLHSAQLPTDAQVPGPSNAARVQMLTNDRHRAALALINAHAHHDDGILGAVTGVIGAPLHLASAATHAIGDIAGGVGTAAEHLGKDIVQLPEHTIQGLWGMGSAWVHDLVHGTLPSSFPGGINNPNSQVAKLSQGLVQNDPALQLITGHPEHAAQLAYAHPLNAITDVGGAGAILGRTAGLASRAAGVAKDLAPAARPAQLAVPLSKSTAGIAPVSRAFSPNLIKAMIQARRGKTPLKSTVAGRSTVPLNGVRVPISHFDREMFKRANEHQLVSESLAQRYEAAARKTVKENGWTGDKASQYIGQQRALGHRAALFDTYSQNALVNPLTGTIFHAGGRATSRTTKAMSDLGAQGYNFTRVALPREITRGGPARSVIVPSTLHDTILAHDEFGARSPNALSGLWQYGTQRFRRTVLPFSTKWITGNVTEAGLRTGLRGALNPMHEKLARNLTDTMRAQGLGQEADRLEAQALQGTHFSMQQRHANQYLAEHPNPLGRTAGKVGHVAGMPADFMFGINARGEQAFARAVLGKHASTYLKAIKRGDMKVPVPQRVAPLSSAEQAQVASRYKDLIQNEMVKHTSRTALRSGTKAYEIPKDVLAGLMKNARDEVIAKRAPTTVSPMEQLAHLYAKPELSASAGRFGREVLGQYGAFGPAARSFTRKFAPFSPWYMNSAKFMGTLPTRHPIFSTLMQDVSRTTDPKWKKEHKAIAGLGGDLQSFPMTGKYSALDIGRYLPPGAFSSGAGMKSPLDQALADFAPVVAPQVADAVKAAFGLDAFGKPLSYPGAGSKYTPTGRLSHARTHYQKPGTPNAAVALSSILGAMLGPTQQVRRIAGERGATPYTGTDLIWNPSPPTKQPKPPLDLQGLLAGINRVLNPLRPADLKPHKRPKTRGGSYGSTSFGGSSYGSTKY